MSRAMPLLIALMGATLLFAVACSTATPTPPPTFNPSLCKGLPTAPADYSCPPQITLSEWTIARTDIPFHQHARVEGVDLHDDPPQPDHPLYLHTLQGNYLWLEVRNSGNGVHRLAVWRGGQVIGDKVEGGSLVGETDLMQPGEIVRLWIYWEGGEYLFNDPMVGHTEKGMHLRIAARESQGVIMPERSFFDPSGDG